MTHRKRRSDRAGREAFRSPGRPTVARRDGLRTFWASIAAGHTSEAAAIDAGVSPAVGVRWFRRAGGMAPSHLSVSAKPPSDRYLSFAEGEEIAILHSQKQGVREIARRLGRAASSISRELRRNAATRSGGLEYRASTAQWHADRSARRPKPSKLAKNDELRHYVQDRLSGLIASANGMKMPGPRVIWKGRRSGPRQHRRWSAAWSPEQIAHRLPLDFPDDKEMRISHEAVYQALYVQGRGALRRELTALPAYRQSVACAAGSRKGTRQVLCLARDHDQRTVSRSGRSSGSGPLGGRSDPGPGKFRDRHACRANNALHRLVASSSHGGPRRCRSREEWPCAGWAWR